MKLLILLLVIVSFGNAATTIINAFASRVHNNYFALLRPRKYALSHSISPYESDVASDDLTTSVRAPLKYIGPYPCLTLKFPDLATTSQRQRNVSGIELDFVLDTAANTNTIQEAVAIELNLAKIGYAPPGLGAADAIQGGDTYLLGDCQLLPDLVLFMTNLSASSLPVASPAAAGLLGIAFLNCFEGGVEFRWSTDTIIDYQSFPTQESNPSVLFHATPHSCNLEGLHPVPITPLNVSQLPSIPITLNGVPMNALLDTGSPITVLNAEAARIARVAAKSVIIRNDENKNRNPFMKALQSIQINAEKARAIANGDILLVAGSGKTVELIQSANPVAISALSSSHGSVAVPLADVPAVYIGDLPGLALLNGLGVSAPPAVILGMDVLRRKKRMVYRAKEVYFD